MIFFTIPTTIKKDTKIIINSFGATNIPSIANSDLDINNLPVPIREDNAQFLGWYYSLNFDEKYKVDPSKKLEFYILNAKYDKCYCFSLRYNVLGLFGKEENSNIDYYIPKGEYKVIFTEFSNAKSGTFKVINNGNVIKEETYNEIGESKNITINEGDYIAISIDSVFEFKRTDVNPEFTKFRYEI